MQLQETLPPHGAEAHYAPAPGGNKALTHAEQRRYQRDGFLCPVSAIGPAHAAEVRSRIESVEAANGGQWPKAQGLKPHLLYPWLDEVVRHPSILDPIEDVLGPDILCWASRFFIKDPGDGGFVSWHQDVTYWGLDITENIVTAWLAFTPATRSNGVMKVIPGSHKKLLPHREGAGSRLTVRGQEVAVEVDESNAVYMELAPGEMSLHHVLLFHASDANTSDQRRIGLAIRYIPTRVKALDGLPKDYVSLVRGVDRYNHFHLETPPKSDCDAAAVAQHRLSESTYAGINAQAAARHADTVRAQG